MTRPLLFALSALALTPPAAAQLTGRPLPHPVFPPPQFEAAITAGTRTRTGEPGPTYWQNRAAYTLRATLDPTTNVLRGEGTIRYRNASPNELPFLVLKLRQNLHREDALRNRRVEITGGISLSGFTVGGRPVAEVTEGAPEPGRYRIDGTILTLALPEPLAPGAEVELAMNWQFRIPAAGAPRMGQDGEVYYIGYWYPQVAVYDDVYGWDTDQYLGLAEHYMGYATYDVTVTAPAGWLVWATGELQNIDEVLPLEIRRRLDRARTTDEIVRVVRENERQAGTSTARGEGGQLTWRFRAENVRDFAFASSNRYVWDATRALVDGGDGTRDTVGIHAFYRPDRTTWRRAAEFARFSIEHLSETIIPYPYPHMTAVEGLIGGGMEYPMMTLIGVTRDDESLFGVTYHEIAHMWFPMIVGQDETAYTWMDEGLVSYNTNVGTDAFFDGSAPNRPEVDAWARNAQFHYFLAGTGYAVEPMRHNDQFPIGGGTQQVDPVQGAARVVASYSTPALLLRAIEGIYGRTRFLEAYQTYARTWSYKHPYPWDLFHSFEATLGEDLDWLWFPTLFETWTVDQAVGAVEQRADAVRVVVRDLGLAPMPAPVRVTYADGTTAEQTVPVATWLAGETEAALTFPAGTVRRVEIDPGGYLPDIDVTNNVWEVEQPVNSGASTSAPGGSGE